MLNLRVTCLACCAIFQVSLLGNCLAQQSESISEDQHLANCLWAKFTSDNSSEATAKVEEMFEKAIEAYPNSAKIRFWRGNLRHNDSNSSKLFSQLAKISEKIIQDTAEEKAKLPEGGEGAGRLAAITNEFVRVKHWIEGIVRKQNEEGTATVAFETPLLEAVELDPKLTSTWSLLMESPYDELALLAADAWAEVDPDNALPFYAKAVVLANVAKKNNDRIPVSVMEAIESGNKRKVLLVPELPWPIDFHVELPRTPETIEAFPSAQGKKIPEGVFRNIIENRFGPDKFQFMFSGTVSSKGLVDLLRAIILDAEKLPPDEEIYRLRTIAECQVRMVHSNRVGFALEAFRARILQRLETLALDRSDLQAAKEFSAIDADLWARRDVIRKAHTESDAVKKLWLDTELDELVSNSNQAVFEALQKLPAVAKVPDIGGQAITEPFRIAAPRTSVESNMVALQVHRSRNGSAFTIDSTLLNRINQDLPPEKRIDPTMPHYTDSEEFEKLGLIPLHDAMEIIRKSKGNSAMAKCRNIFLVADRSRNNVDLHVTSVLLGYISKRDRFFIGFRELDDLIAYQEDQKRGRPAVRLALILEQDLR